MREIVPPAGEGHATRQAEPAGPGANVRPELAIAHDEEVQIRTNSKQRNGGGEEKSVVLDRREPADDSDQWRTRIESEFAAKRASILPAANHRRQVEPGFDNADALGRRHLELHEIVFDPGAHREQTIRRAREHPLGAPRQPGFDRAVVSLQYVAVVDVQDDG